jgi:hypothetical protein
MILESTVATTISYVGNLPSWRNLSCGEKANTDDLGTVVWGSILMLKLPVTSAHSIEPFQIVFEQKNPKELDILWVFI